MSDSDDDWFKKDEDEIVNNLEKKVRLDSEKHDSHEEHINCFDGGVEEYIKQLNLDACAVKPNEPSKTSGLFTATELDNMLKMTPLDMFIYCTSENRNFFADQVAANHSQKRVQQYIEIFTMICKLELAGFDVPMLKSVLSQIPLLEQLKRFIVKFFASSLKGNCDVNAERLLSNIKWLFIRAHKLRVLSLEGYNVLKLMKTLLTQRRSAKLSSLPVCIELAQELKECGIGGILINNFGTPLPIQSDEMEVSSYVNTMPEQIYPTLEDIKLPASGSNAKISESCNQQTGAEVSTYLEKQRNLMRDDFLEPLRKFISRLRTGDTVKELQEEGLLWMNVQLILNPIYKEAQRHSFIRVKLRSNTSQKITEKEEKFLQNLKTGTLLCFTTSLNFDNLLLATVVYTEPAALQDGLISVDIAKQYNIGNIYNTPLIMFETPVFFEPYLRVYNYLRTCSIESFPMRQYIVEGTVTIKPPAYLNPNTQYTYCGEKFLVEKAPINVPLNLQQKEAFRAALTQEFCLVQGPPGTGKTQLSFEVVKTLIENAKATGAGPIIVVTYTNDSLDKFLLKICHYTRKILRFGSQSRQPEIANFNSRAVVDVELIPKRLKRAYWLVNNEYKARFAELQLMHDLFDGSESSYQEILLGLLKLQEVDEKLMTIRTMFQYYEARNKDLIAMTTTCAARLNYLFRFLKSRIIVFEEAAEIQEPHIVACLTPYIQHVIMVGDHQQLQPHTGTHKHQGLGVSLFERLISEQFPVVVLNVQYRMRVCIADLLVPTIYAVLQSDDSVMSYPDIRHMVNNLYFVKHIEPEQQLSDMSFINSYEANTMVTLANHLLSNGGYESKDIVILSPYLAQVELLKKLLIKTKIMVTTIDSFQGLEANIVLLSLVRSNNCEKIGFLNQPNRVCVALSRARWGLYMIGNIDTLVRGSGGNLWSTIEEKLQKKDLIGIEFPIITQT